MRGETALLVQFQLPDWWGGFGAECDGSGGATCPRLSWRSPRDDNLRTEREQGAEARSLRNAKEKRLVQARDVVRVQELKRVRAELLDGFRHEMARDFPHDLLPTGRTGSGVADDVPGWQCNDVD